MCCVLFCCCMLCCWLCTSYFTSPLSGVGVPHELPSVSVSMWNKDEERTDCVRGVSMPMRTYVYIKLFVWAPVWVCKMCMCISASTCMCINACVCLYVCMYVCAVLLWEIPWQSSSHPLLQGGDCNGTDMWHLWLLLQQGQVTSGAGVSAHESHSTSLTPVTS